MKKIIIASFIFLLASVSIVLAISKSRDIPNYKTCLSNLRALQGAVEMYKMDIPNAIVDKSDDFINTLKNYGYIKSIPEGPESSCKYVFKGKLSENGEFYCEYHGGIDKEKIKPCPQFAEILESNQRYQERLDYIGILEVLLIVFVVYNLIKFLKFLCSPNKKLIEFK